MALSAAWLPMGPSEDQTRTWFQLEASWWVVSLRLYVGTSTQPVPRWVPEPRQTVGLELAARLPW